MKNFKTVGIAAVAAMALMAFASGSASAAGGMLYNGATTVGVGSAGSLTIPSGSSVKLVDTSNNVLDTCTKSAINGELTNAGSSTVNPTGSITELTWESCTFTTKTVSTGNKLEEEWTSGTTGIARSDSRIEVTMNSGLFGSCIYGVESGTNIGTLTTASSGTATLDVNTVATRFGSNFACPTTGKFTGTYTSTVPDNLRIEAS